MLCYSPAGIAGVPQERRTKLKEEKSPRSHRESYGKCWRNWREDTCCQSPEKTTRAAYTSFFGGTQVLSGLAGVPKRETRPETWQRLQAVPVLEKRQTGGARLTCLLGGPDSVPAGGRESWGGSPCCRGGFCPWPSKERLVKQLRSRRALLLAF
ncbi:uncharacterized protein M6G45_010138 isoform 1-T3 [Spheniscus humboldti]